MVEELLQRVHLGKPASLDRELVIAGAGELLTQLDLVARAAAPTWSASTCLCLALALGCWFASYRARFLLSLLSGIGSFGSYEGRSLHSGYWFA
jgi:hypothetical protein